MAHQPFSGAVPDGLLYDTRYDMWVREDGDALTIGITAFGVFLAGEIIAFTAKPKGAEVEAGRGLGTVESAKTVLAVHAPCAFRLDEINEALEDNPAPINATPYAAWLVRGSARDWARDRARLVDAAAYRAHILAVEPEARFT
ncbi:glycine cleavage system protein H [Azospira restricta]|uniref:Glycine cleavage system protein H n=1 Tax=Azospira restricta TaxID=404405 RepID=A0A974SQN7_9RHOO|nr:glycine cleavage system protein H [Azospira restricta]QRJ64676.1 glycine cleavage system protein H [Azospira restricta]